MDSKRPQPDNGAMDTTPRWIEIAVHTIGELAIALIALPLYVFLVLPKHGEGGLPGFSPVIADGLDPLLAVFAAACTLAASVVLTLALIRLFEHERTIPDRVGKLADKSSLLELIPMHAAAGFAEEFLFRVVCIDLCGLLVASLLFTAAHYERWKRPLLLAEIFVVALLLGFLYLFTRSLLLCALVHFAYNQVATYLENIWHEAE